MTARAGRETVARGLAIAGGLAFAASLLFFLYVYLDRFGRPAAGSADSNVLGPALADAALFALFGLHHSVCARTGLKRRIDRAVSPRYERSIYVWISSGLFGVLCALWQPVPGVLWAASATWTPPLLALQLLGIVLSVRAAARIDVLDLAGIRQAFDLPAPAARLSRTGVYGFVRHPIYLGWLLLVWATPTMTGTRLVFAAISTLYLVVAVPFEERDLARTFGGAYESYRRDVRWRMIPLVY
jgi:protein-S-isoprenylcysteine O-methyltransferase Ste14